MRKVKFFKSVESELNNLEAEINDWLADSGCELVSITGNIAPQTGVALAAGTFAASDIFVIVVYEDGR